MWSEYKEDITGRIFNNLEVLKFNGRASLNSGNKTTPTWLCRCSCGYELVIREGNLKNGTRKSCKVFKQKRRLNSLFSKKDIPFKVSSERLHNIWAAMKQRCYNPNNVSYKNYGGKGVCVCEEWKDSYKNFREWSLSNGYSDELTIDRKDFNGDYEPSNCRWISLEENNKESFDRHYSAKTGLFSQTSLEKVGIVNKNKLGCKFSMYLDGELITDWECLIDCAKYICKIKDLKTEPLQIKKNISACLNGKRDKCHDFTFKFKDS